MFLDDPRNRQLMNTSRLIEQFADELFEWTSQYASQRRRSALGQVTESQEFDLGQWRREAARLVTAASKPAAVSLYGPSQVGKSLFVSRVLEPFDEAFSPLGMSDRDAGYVPELSFRNDLNPSAGENEATAIMTRFSTKDRISPPPPAKFPVKVRALSRGEWIKVLARGADAECHFENKEKLVWGEDELQSLFKKVSVDCGADHVDREWRFDLFDAYSYMREKQPRVFAAKEALFNSYLTEYPLDEAGYIQLAANLFWFGDRFPALTEWFSEVYAYLREVECAQRNREEAVGDPSIVVHWAAVRFLLDSQLKESHDPKSSKWRSRISRNEIVETEVDGWKALDYREGSPRGLSERDQARIQSAMLEMVIPVLPDRLSENWRQVLGSTDILDVPGARALGGRFKEVNGVKDCLLIVRRGKVDFLFDQYIEERQVQTLLLLISGRILEVKQLVKDYVDKWGRIRYGRGWPIKLPQNEPVALFVGMTGIDAELTTGGTKPSGLYKGRISKLRDEVLLDVMRHFGGKDQPFTNIFPIRYPGSWDKTEEERRTSTDPSLWEEAERDFVSCEIVMRFVANHEDRWRCAMRDGDGGLSLLCDAFANATSAHQKQASLEKEMQKLYEDLWNLGEHRWYCDPSMSEQRQVRRRHAEKILDWLGENKKVAFARVYLLQSALCVEQDDIGLLAEPMVQRQDVLVQQPESLRQRVHRQLTQLLEDWSSAWALERWAKQEERYEGVAGSLSREDFSTFVSFLHDYLTRGKAADKLLEAMVQVAELYKNLPQAQDAIHRHGRREYMELILNDFIMNPGEGIQPEGEQYAVDGEFALMRPFVDRWRCRLPHVLENSAGDETDEPPAGNEELRAILDKYEMQF